MFYEYYDFFNGYTTEYIRAVTITALPLHRGNEMRPRCWGHNRHHRTVFRGIRPNVLQRGNKTR